MAFSAEPYPTDQHGWAELLPERKPAQSLQGAHRVPWAVVGAGLTGLACARRLAALHPDAKIFLLEARRVAQGASGRNSGFVVATSQFPGRLDHAQLENYRRINRINQAGLDLLSDQVSRHAVDCQWRRDGFYHTAVDRPALMEYENFRHYLDNLQVEHELLDKTILQERLGSALYQAGIHIADGALVQPAALVRGLADTLPANVSLYEQSPVLRIERGKPLTLKLENARIEADRVILATNYEAPADRKSVV